MEYHWYEDYWAMPRNLPKGHQFFIGYYQTQRAKRFRVENIHTDQSVFLSTWLLDNGYRVFLHFKSGIVTELKLGDNPPPVGRIDSGWDDRYGGNLRLFVQSDRLLPQRFWT